MRDGSVRYGRCKRRVTRENKSWFFVVLIIDFLPRNSRSQNGNSNSYDFGFRCALRPAIATHAKECGIARQPKTRIEEKRSEMWSTSLWRRKQRTRLEMDWIGVRDFAGVFVYLREPQRLGRPGGMPRRAGLWRWPCYATISWWSKSIPTQRTALCSIVGLPKNFINKYIPSSKIVIVL